MVISSLGDCGQALGGARTLPGAASWGSEIDKQGMGILALGDTVSQNARPGQSDKLGCFPNFAMLRMRGA
jgi:hypothetical protein